MSKIKEKINTTLIVLLSLALLAIIVTFIILGLVFWFWIILFIWIAVFSLFFFTKIFKVLLWFWIAFIFCMLISGFITFLIKPNSNIKSTPKTSENIQTETVNGIKVTDCTSTLTDQPINLDNWKVSLYSAPLRSDSASSSEATDVRTFSLKAIKDKTSAQSMFVDLRKGTDEMIAGYDTVMEVCNSNNKANYSYVTKTQDSPVGENVVARTHYFHGGAYLFEPGTYRVDAYIKDLSGKWNLVGRVTDITVTE